MIFKVFCKMFSADFSRLAITVADAIMKTEKNRNVYRDDAYTLSIVFEPISSPPPNEKTRIVFTNSREHERFGQTYVSLQTFGRFAIFFLTQPPRPHLMPVHKRTGHDKGPTLGHVTETVLGKRHARGGRMGDLSEAPRPVAMARAPYMHTYGP